MNDFEDFIVVHSADCFSLITDELKRWYNQFKFGATERISVYQFTENEFICSRSHSEEYTRSVSAGKTLIPIRDVREVCDEYKRKEQ